MSKIPEEILSTDKVAPTPKSYIREVNFNDNTLPAGVANNGFTAVMPASRAGYRGVLFTVQDTSGPDKSSYIDSEFINFVSEQDTVDTVTASRVLRTFTVGAKVRLEVFVRETENAWTLGTPSDEITII